MSESPSERRQRREVYYRGRVQGVGFRYTTSSLATRFDLTGYVQNLRDGRVRVVVEGAKAELDRFLGVVSDRMGQYIDDTSEETSPATGEFEDFGVRF